MLRSAALLDDLASAPYIHVDRSRTKLVRTQSHPAGRRSCVEAKILDGQAITDSDYRGTSEHECTWMISLQPITIAARGCLHMVLFRSGDVIRYMQSSWRAIARGASVDAETDIKLCSVHDLR